MAWSNMGFSLGHEECWDFAKQKVDIQTIVENDASVALCL